MPVAGYTGLYRQPFADDIAYGETCYVIADDAHRELNILMLTPGAYAEIFRMASAITFQRINLFTPAMDALFLSDVFRLVVDLQKIKHTVRWYYPESVSLKPANTLFQTAHVRTNYFISKVIPDLTIEIKPAAPLEENKAGIYDFRLYDGSMYDLFSIYMTTDKLAELMQSNFDQIHFPYNSTFYGGCTVREMSIHNEWRGGMVPNNFMSKEEFREAQHGMYGKANRIVF